VGKCPAHYRQKRRHHETNTLKYDGKFTSDTENKESFKGTKGERYEAKKPIDSDILHTVGKKFKKVITIEDGTIVGGMGSAILEFFADHNYHPKVTRLGVPDQFVDHGTQQQLYKECGYDVQGICQAVKALIKPGILSNAG